MVRAAGIYAHISSDPEDTQLGVRRQVEDCTTLAQRLGWPLAERYIDNDQSAYSGKPRPAYRRMLADIKAGDIDAVLVWSSDRLCRNPAELEDFIILCEGAQALVASVAGEIDLSTPEGRLMIRVTGNFARHESEVKSRRLRRKHLELAQHGKVSGGGYRPFGYAADRRTILADEADIIREVARRLLAGDSLRSIVNDLNARGITTSAGNSWSPIGLRRVMVAARHSGQREHHGEITAPAEWPGILTQRQTARLRALFAHRAMQPRRAPRTYVLKGLLRCALCGTTLVSRPKANGRRGYICSRDSGGCGRLSIVADALEAFIAEAILYRLDSPAVARALVGGRASDAEDSAQRELEDARAHLSELASLYGERQITKSEWLDAKKPIEHRLASARKRLARFDASATLDGFAGNPAALRAEWSTLTLARQHAIITALVDHVEVRSAVRGRNFFDPGRIRPVWRR